jgi:archaetidylinositol phosphate synthase
MLGKGRKMTQHASTSSNPAQHTRINESLLGGAERKALQWLAAHMPAWVVPDTLTGIGLFASFLIFVSYALTFYHIGFLWLASFAFVLNWFGDSLDGTLARYRKIERPRYGFFVDHIIDSVSEVLIFLGLGLSPFLRFDLALLALVAYMLLSIYVYLVTYVNGVFRISYARLGPTEVRVIGILANTFVFFYGNPTVALPWVTLKLYDVLGIFVLVAILIVFLVASITTAMSLSREDREAYRQRKLNEQSARKAHTQSLRDERAMRKAAAKAARRPRVRMEIDRS